MPAELPCGAVPGLRAPTAARRAAPHQVHKGSSPDCDLGRGMHLTQREQALASVERVRNLGRPGGDSRERGPGQGRGAGTLTAHPGSSMHSCVRAALVLCKLSVTMRILFQLNTKNSYFYLTSPCQVPGPDSGRISKEKSLTPSPPHPALRKDSLTVSFAAVCGHQVCTMK